MSGDETKALEDYATALNAMYRVMRCERDALCRRLRDDAAAFEADLDEMQAQLDGALIALEGMRAERDELRARLAAAEGR